MRKKVEDKIIIGGKTGGFRRKHSWFIPVVTGFAQKHSYRK